MVHFARTGQWIWQIFFDAPVGSLYCLSSGLARQQQLSMVSLDSLFVFSPPIIVINPTFPPEYECLLTPI
jgi:hypothetical protein